MVFVHLAIAAALMAGSVLASLIHEMDHATYLAVLSTANIAAAGLYPRRD